MFFHFSQNNSGGSFDGPAHHVIVEANSADEANRIAGVELELYFNGCDIGWDCPCCGDRWSEQYDDSDGYDRPAVYGETDLAQVAADDMWADRVPASVLVRYLDGREETF